jgi:site-specific recombinase XerD
MVKEPVPLSFDEMIRLVEAVEDNCASVYKHRNVAILQILFHCALRVTEVVSLDLSQLDFDNYLFLNVRRKGGKELAAAFNDVVAESIEKYLAVRDEFAPEGGDQALFLSDRKRRLSVRAVQEMVRRYAELAGISRRVSPHLLRHSSATQLVEVGTPLRVVQEICGHASVSTTQRYVHVNNGQRRRAVDALGERWKSESRSRRRVASADDGLDGPDHSASN